MKVENPFFSVIIPAYNVSKHIKNALDSVRLQTFDNYEIIVVNDGSEDDTFEVIKDYFLEFSTLSNKIICQENKGIGGARNSGIKVAEGEFVAFLDADDRWYKEKLSKVRDFIEKHPMVDLVCHDECWIRNGKVKERVSYGPYKTYKDLLFKGNCMSTSATIVDRSKIIEAKLFSENMDYNGVEDYELWLRLSKICQIMYFHEILGEYHIQDGGITSNMEKHNHNSLNVIEHHFSQWPNKTVYYKYLMLRRRSNAIMKGGINFIKAGDFSSARTYFIRSLLLNPFSMKVWILFVICFMKIKL